MATAMKKISIWICSFAILLLAACSTADDKQKDLKILQLQTALIAQQGARDAELQFADGQAGMYLGCKKFFNLCGDEIRQLGQMRLNEGFSGVTSLWYWIGILAHFFCIGLFCAVIFTSLRYLHLTLLEPEEKHIERLRHFIETANERIRSANLRANKLELGICALKNELAKLHDERSLLKKSIRTDCAVQVQAPAMAIAKTKILPEQDY